MGIRVQAVSERYRIARCAPEVRIGGEVHIARTGDRTSALKVLLLHGVGLSHATWLPVLRRLGPIADFAAADLLGHGRSVALRGTDVSMQAQTYLIPELLDRLGWPAAVLVGHSMGGGASLGAALCWPSRVRGLALVDSVAYPQRVPLRFVPMRLPLAGLGLAAVCRFARPTGGARILAAMGYDPAAAADYLETLSVVRQAQSVARAVRDLRPDRYRRFPRYYGSVRQPVLIIHGRCDGIVPPAVARRLEAALPDSDTVWVEGASHIPQESHAAAVADALGGFLRSRFAADAR